MSCNTIIDYSQIIGERILPFTIELDLNNSVLNPPIGENQRFCYIVKGIGNDISIYADLSHLVLSICDQITESEIVNITVTINGVVKTIIFEEGGNVELKTPNMPDPPTGCPGLKFDFGLNKVNGVMNFCFELKSVYPIGSNEVCLSGGGTTARGLSICGPICKDEPQGCSKEGYQRATVCAPVTITPFTVAKSTTTFCCGTPTISSGISRCDGIVNGNCKFTLSQRICVAVPVEFGAESSVGLPSVECGNASSDDICTNC